MDITSDIVTPYFDADHWSHPWWQFHPDESYTRRLEGWLRMGYIAMTEVDLSGRGTYYSDTGYTGTTNHFVLLDGVKSVWEDRSRVNYVHVVCSANGAYWIRTREFLKKYGGSGWRLATKERE